jgi:hypothetical protein
MPRPDERKQKQVRQYSVAIDSPLALLIARPSSCLETPVIASPPIGTWRATLRWQESGLSIDGEDCRIVIVQRSRLWPHCEVF